MSKATTGGAAAQVQMLRQQANDLMQTGQPLAALEFLERLLEVDPSDALTLNDHGNALQDLQRLPAALESYDGALRMKPDFAAALVNRANALRLLKRHDEALRDLGRAQQLQPAFPEALNSRGNILSDLGRLEEALESFDQAVAMRAGFTLARVNRGKLLLDLYRPREALEAFERAIQDVPTDAEAHFGRASALLQLGEHLDVAAAEFDRSAVLGIERPEALVGRAAALTGLGRDAEAAACVVQLLRLAPDRDYALGGLVISLLRCASWSNLAAFASEVCDRVREGRRAIHPHALLAISDEPELHLAAARVAVADKFAANGSLGPCPARRPSSDADSSEGRIRLAYVSADFREHPVSYLLVDTLERHDRERFEVIGVSLRARGEGAFERRVLGAFDRVVDVSRQTDRQAATLLRDLRVDIAVDLMGFTEGLRLGIFAHRAAPVQVNYLGYAATSGAPYMDYLIADGRVIPPAEARWYSERIVRLPQCYLPTDSGRQAMIAPTRASLGLPEQATILCAFTSLYKINPLVFNIWMRLLAAAPRSVLWLREVNVTARSHLLQQAAAFGVGPERLVFAPSVPSAAHWARQSVADLFLDTVPYNAHSTACEALWAGLPVLTCAGRGMASRAAASALDAVGLPDLITDTLEEYERRALQLLRSPEQLVALKAKLLQQRASCRLFDTERYRRHLEAAYQRMHDTSQRGLAPITFSVDEVLA